MQSLYKGVCIYAPFLDEELYGDFEDLETGDSSKQIKNNKPVRDDDDIGDSHSSEAENGGNEEDENEKRLAKKRKLKENFDVEYPFHFSNIFKKFRKALLK